MKIKRLILSISILCFSLLFTGCGESLYTMTPEEEAVITLYASKTVSKFNKNQTTGIANARVKPGELDEDYDPEEQEEETAEIPEEENVEVEIDPESGEPIIAEPTETEEDEDVGAESGYSFTNAVSVPGVEFTCSEFDVTPEFKTKSFLLSKISGKQYVVLYIDATNTTDSAIDFSEVAERSYSLSLNGGAKASTQYTPLSNDLANFDSILTAGETKSFVLVFLFNNASVENITSLELFVSSEGTTRGTTI